MASGSLITDFLRFHGMELGFIVRLWKYLPWNPAGRGPVAQVSESTVYTLPITPLNWTLAVESESHSPESVPWRISFLRVCDVLFYHLILLIAGQSIT